MHSVLSGCFFLLVVEWRKMKIKKVETKDEVIKMCQMKAGSKEQNDCLLQMQKENELDYNSCFIMVDGKEVVARVIMMECYMGFFTVLDIAICEIVEFIHYLQKGKNLLTFHLYSDKVNHDAMMQALHLCDFKITQDKESYVCYPNRLKTLPYHIEVNSLEDEEYVQLFERALYQHKDRSFQKDAIEYGKKQASEMHYKQCMQIDSEVYRIVLLVNDCIVGFVFLARFQGNVGGISYIGVVKEERGKGYGKVLLEYANNIAYEKQIHKIIADIDVENTYMRECLFACEYKMDCTEKVFDWKR